MARQQDGKELTFEQALARLETIVQSIEQGKIGLQDSILKYEEGMKLKVLCQKMIAEAEQKIQKLQIAGDQIHTEPFEPNPDTGEEA